MSLACPSCSFENPPDVRFCGSCGAALAAVCAVCGAESPPGFRFCGSCGAPLDGETQAPVPAVAAAGERRRVTVLFADLVGFSTLAEHLDPEELRTLMASTFSELTEEVEAREGWVEKFIGDAVVAVFGAPVTHEDDPVRAVETALALLEVVRRRSEGAPAPVQLRIGINSGLVVAGAVGDGTQTGVMGDAVNVAARLQQTAEPGQVLVSAPTWRRVRHAFEAEPAGALEVKGKTQPVEAYLLTGRREAELRDVSPFVGRREELALVELLWSSARKGNTHVVSVTGEPGVGKTRLLSEFRPRGATLDVRVACGGGRAFGPFLDVVAAMLGSLPADQAELASSAGALGVGEEEAALLGTFLGLGDAPPVVRMADEQQKQQVFSGVWHFLFAALRDRPAVIALDDVHWADESSRDLLAFLLERLGGLPLMLLLCYRPGFEPIARSELRASHTVARLEPLTADESVELARGLLGVGELPHDLERLVATRAEGNPFFIEELLQALVELGSLAVVDGQAVLAKVDVAVPDTVQGTILARVDRLGERERSVLQHAAVLGRASSIDLLEAVMGEGDLSEPLAALTRSQLLVMPRPGEWEFKHALIQEVTYETLLLRRRRELHLGVARALEARAGDDPGLLEELAEHYARADAPEQARGYAVAAGDLAQERMGFVEARRRYEAALRLWGEGDEKGRLELLSKLGRAASLSGDVPGARTALVEAAEGWERLGERHRAGGALAQLGRVYWQSAEAGRAAETLERAIAMLGDEASPELVDAYVRASALHMLSGRLAEGTRLAVRGIELAESLGLEGSRSHLLNTLGACEVFAGNPEGVEKIAAALEIARSAGDAEALGRAYVNLSDTLVKAGRLREAVAVAEEGREAMRRAGSPNYEWFVAANGAHALVELGRLAEAEALARLMLEEHEAVLGAVGKSNAAGALVRALVRRGAYSEARTVADEMLPLTRGIGGADFLANALMFEAELESGRENAAAARQALREAADVVREEDARYHTVLLLPLAARLLPDEEVKSLLELAANVPSFPPADALRAEAEAVLADDTERLREAAGLYRALEMPYDEARCLIGAGELERASELVESFGFGDGPLGDALRAVASSAAQ